MDMETLMAQAQDLQSKISSAQDELAQKRVKGIAGDGAVVVDMTGKYDIISVNINPKAMSVDAPTLSQMVADAYRDAKEKADILIDKTMSAITGEMSE